MLSVVRRRPAAPERDSGNRSGPVNLERARAGDLPSSSGRRRPIRRDKDPGSLKIPGEAADHEGSGFAPAGRNERRSGQGQFRASGEATGGHEASPPWEAKTANPRTNASLQNRHIHGGENTMALVVNTNGLEFNRSLQRLSSGLRVNSAGDDAAGLAISTRLGSQVRGLNQAIRNANDGSALLQTAEGALNEITNIATRIKELSVQSANGTNSTTDRASLNSEGQSLISEVTQIATQTKFGSTALLDGSFSGTFQVGVEIGQTVSQSISNFKASALAGNVASQALTFQAAVTNL